MGAIYIVYIIPVVGIPLGLFCEIYLTAIGLSRVYKIGMHEAGTSAFIVQIVFLVAFFSLVYLIQPLVGDLTNGVV